MASSSGGNRRKKRAWRKPREEIGPGTVDLINEKASDSIYVPMETASHYQPVRINRTVLHSNEVDVRDSVTSANDRGTPPAKDTRPDKKRVGATEQSPRQRSAQGGGTESVEQSIADTTAINTQTDRPVQSTAGVASVSRDAAVTGPSRSSRTETPLVIDGSILEGVSPY